MFLQIDPNGCFDQGAWLLMTSFALVACMPEATQTDLHCVRQTDTIARTGGGEFVVILNGLSTALSTTVAQGQQTAAKIPGALSTPALLTTAPNESDSSRRLSSATRRRTASVGATC